MPRCGSCWQALQDAYFDHDRSGGLRRTCPTCLVSWPNHSMLCLFIIYRILIIYVLGEAKYAKTE